MSNRFKGEVTVRDGDDEYTLVFTIGALIALEERFDRSVQEVGEMLGERLRMVDLRTVFTAALREYHPDIGEEAAGQIMSRVGVAEAGALVTRAFSAAFGVGEVADGAPVPPAKAAARRKAGTGATA